MTIGYTIDVETGLGMAATIPAAQWNEQAKQKGVKKPSAKKPVFRTPQALVCNAAAFLAKPLDEAKVVVTHRIWMRRSYQ